MRLRRRLRRLSRRQPPLDPRRQISAYERVYPFGWLGVLVDKPPVSARTDLRQPRARLRALLDALGDAQPLLSAMPARRACRGLARRQVLGGAVAPSRSGGGAQSCDGGPIEKSIAPLRSFVAEPMRYRQSVPRRRRRPYRAADRRQGPESRRQRRRLSLESLIERYQRTPRRTRRLRRTRRSRASGRPSVFPGG